ncbi:hypothetical protein ABXT08_01510 [Chryseobacterium sp. NRRL B-14859]|uniref:hypothetical protein n=1 Tax=unclassified Chryseobacterium TaxID=2593645 RepID=UPI000F45ABE2|nr:hypothetical protein [Chryseobacterium sp. G0240]ROI01317.1 hypothetical protein EGI16_17480 [Chryseobacterium sp. G0240]
MKKSRSIQLLFVTGVLAACSQEKPKEVWKNEKKVYMRSDTTASYTRSHGFMPGYFWYHAFRPYGYYHNGFYQRGYYSDAISSKSNIGRSSYKGKVVRGGLGRSGFRASS